MLDLNNLNKDGGSEIRAVNLMFLDQHFMFDYYGYSSIRVKGKCLFIV